MILKRARSCNNVNPLVSVIVFLFGKLTKKFGFAKNNYLFLESRASIRYLNNSNFVITEYLCLYMF